MIYQLGDWQVEPAVNELRKDGSTVQLDGKAMDVLAFLLQQGDQVTSTEDILQSVWADRVVEQSTVHRRINQIRQALDDDPKNPTYIRTIVRRGYQIIAPVSIAGGDALAAGAAAQAETATLAETATHIPHPTAGKADHAQKRWQLPLGITAAVVLAIAAWFFLQPREPVEEAVIPSWQQSFEDTEIIAVLPFQQAVDAGLEHLGPSLRAEISARMSGLDSITLIADYSAFKVVERSRDVREIGRILGADYVVEGHVRSDGKNTRVSITLSDTTNGQQVWQHNYTQQFDQVAGIFELYDEIASSLVVQLGVYIDRDFARYFIPQPPPTNDIEAYNLVRRARIAFAQQRLADCTALAEAAINRDPDYYLAHHFKALSLFIRAENGLMPRMEGLMGAKASYQRALELAPDFPHANFGLGAVVMRMDLNFPEAKRQFEKAYELGMPKEIVQREIAELYFNNGRYAEALALHQQVAHLNPLQATPKMLIGRTYARMGETEKAMAAFEAAMQLAGPADNNLFAEYFPFVARQDLPRAQAMVAEGHPYIPVFWPSYVALLSGNPEPRQKLLAEMEKMREHAYVSPWILCVMHYTAGNYEAHLRWFQITVEEAGANHYTYDHFYGNRPDYWDNLENWAGSTEDAAEQARRTALVDNHEAQVTDLLKSIWLD